MSDEAKEKILEAGSRCVARNGIRGLRVSDVAKEAGVSNGLIYYHFVDRQGLLTAMLEFVHRRSRDRLTQRPDSETVDDVLDVLFVDVSEDQEVRDNSVVWNEVRAIAVFEEDLRQALATVTRLWERDTASDLERLTSVQNPERTALVLTALVEGLSSRWLTGQLSADEVKEIIRAVATQLGILSTERTRDAR
ncbi:TetR/AcrR family transcriptional regulator [Streptomyces sp. NPDC056255]|uniref:TetR/AcrR family transcriptional regulator n=1 Tax=Streptomyces sp. NPDC056255 TaxID=3345764 RepID=UPI0035E1ED9D